MLRALATILVAGSVVGLALPRVSFAAPPSSAPSVASEGSRVEGPSLEVPILETPGEPPKSGGELELGQGARGETPHDTSLGLFAQGVVAEAGSTPGTAALRLRALDENTGARSRDGLHHGLLGVLLTGTAAGLIAFGSVQFVRAREHVEFCRPEPVVIDERPAPPGINPCTFDPPSLGFASAGLSWGFSAALLVGAGLLLARGVRLQAGARRADRAGRELGQRLSVSPWWRAGGGAALRWRF